MLIYQARPRSFRLACHGPLQFPAECTAEFVLRPKQPFGEEVGGGRTHIEGDVGPIRFSANNGFFECIPHSPLAPLDVTVVEQGVRRIVLSGCTLKVTEHCDSLEDLHQLIEAIFFVLPVSLAVRFADPPYVERVSGVIGDLPFRWELDEVKAPYDTTSQERQEQAFIDAWKSLAILFPLENRRLAGALHYLHVAMRLSRSGQVAGEFLPEVILNLAKSLETLFNTQNYEEVRQQLASLDFDPQWGETYILPAMVLRNNLDVAHVSLAVLSRAQLRAVQAYADNAESQFRRLFQRVMERSREGSFRPLPYVDHRPSASVTKLVERLRAAFPE